MNLEQMEYIKEIIHTRSISVAAQNLHISQSAISQSISSLEKELGITLFKRSRFGTTPTEEGKSIINKALKIVENIDKIKEDALTFNTSYTGELKIASIPSLMAFLPKVLSLFKKDFPQIKVTILEMESSRIIEEVKENRLNFGLTTIQNPVERTLPDQCIFKPIPYQTDIKVIVPKDSPLAFQDALSMQEILDYPIVMHTSHYWDKLITSYETAEKPINLVFRTSNFEVIKKTVAEGLAISMLSHYLLTDDPYVESERIVPVTIADPDIVSEVTFGCLYSEKNPQLPLVKKFLDYVEQYMY
ncbi:LysR family transcriptional regulator [Metabacillus sp. GX 13764]|uniref:LysR family transcriptional regulator n=1 Tax=Metabacillus kandeliae TaxID=2900151 RepID=UPI001E41B266|nr:LysR family transcriptional regulator [Metabacillus kandeliae]MCD7034233.1 LysR family transcriptional regulator [Metabacillus kandeliae]